jgi:phospholipid/cholesterol/gamma-HCH transport system ATP-binding protein
MSPPESTDRGVSVEVRGLRKSFDGQMVLKGIDLKIAAGEIFVVMGPSGAGKSVLLKQIIGLETPDQGEVLIEGISVQGANVMDRFRLAMIFQSGALLNSLTVGENVGLYLREHRIKPSREIDLIVREKLDLVGLKGVEDRYPGELSGGMRKRVAIARGLVIEPQLLLYDEPTGELDPVSAVTIAEEILNLNRRIHATSVVVTHDRDLAFGVADRIAIIDEGRIVLVASPDDVRADPNPVVRRFITADFRKEKPTL